MKNTTWTTHRTLGYTYDVAQDQASAGGVHHHQVRRTKNGWQARIIQSNGQHSAAGPVRSISEEEGKAAFASAQ